MSAEIIPLPVVRAEPEPSGNGAREALASSLEIYGMNGLMADGLLFLLWGHGFKIVPVDGREG
jgi:hypothetical protein